MESITVTIPAQEWDKDVYNSNINCYLAQALKSALPTLVISIGLGYDKEGNSLVYPEPFLIDQEGMYSRATIGEWPFYDLYITTEPFNSFSVKAAFDAGQGIKVTLKKL